MRKILIKNNFVLQILITLLVAIVVGFYINLITGLYLEKIKEPGSTIFSTIKELDWWNILGFLIILLIIFQLYLQNLSRQYVTTNINDIIVCILETSCKSLIYPHDSKHIRAIITICDNKRNLRYTKYTYNAESDPERVAEFPLDFGITGKSYKSKSVILEELPVRHHKLYSDKTKDNILASVRTILAAPLLNPDNLNENPIGILAFDSILSISELNWDSIKIRKIAQEWGDIIAKLLVYTEKT